MNPADKDNINGMLLDNNDETREDGLERTGNVARR